MRQRIIYILFVVLQITDNRLGRDSPALRLPADVTTLFHEASAFTLLLG